MENKFPELLKMLRVEKKISQNKLAKMLGVTQQCISEWELGKTEPTLSSLWELADFFDVSIDEICGRREWD